MIEKIIIKRLMISGKMWPYIYQIEIVK